MLTVLPQTWLCQRLPTGKVRILFVYFRYHAETFQIFATNVFFFGVMTFAIMGAKNVGEILSHCIRM